MKSKKKILAVLSGFGILIMVLVLYAFKTDSSIDEGYVSQPPWENLQVLPKDISKDSLIHLMKNYAASLGVKCNYCHMPNQLDPKKLDFASDAKIEKKITRGMIKMTDEINETYFKPHFPDPKPKQVYVANCVLCHRGTANPKNYLSDMGLMYNTYESDESEKDKG